MVAGIQVAAMEIELCGGNNDIVPRQLVVPESGQLVDVTKYYWCNADTKSLKKEETALLIDTRANEYLLNKQGFVIPKPKAEEQAEANAQAQEAKNGGQS